jgi:hypothetical protein
MYGEQVMVFGAPGIISFLQSKQSNHIRLRLILVIFNLSVSFLSFCAFLNICVAMDEFDETQDVSMFMLPPGTSLA